MNFLLLPIAALLFLPYAISAEGKNEYSLETIEVKANKEKKTYKQSTESIAVLKTEDRATPIKENNIETLNGVANITINREDETFTIRGVKNVGVTGYQKDNLASILVDNIFQTDLASRAGSFNLWDLDSLEVYRGAQSTTQGINSLAGSFNIFHNAPKNTTENAIKLEAGSEGKKGLSFMTNNILIEDKFLYRLSGLGSTSDGHITNVTTKNDEWAKRDYYNLNLDFLYKINPENQIKLTNKFFKSKIGGSYVHGPNPYAYEVFEDIDSSIKTTNIQTGLEYLKEINENISNQILLNYSNSEQKTSTDSDLTSLNRTGVRKDYHRDNFMSLENLFKYKSKSIKNVLGVHVHRFSLIDNYDFNVIPISNNAVSLNIKQYVDRKRNTYSIFDSFLYEFTENHSLNLGARYEHVNNKYLTNVSGSRVGTSGSGAVDTNLDNYVIARSGAYGGDKGEGKVLPKVGYLYNLENQTFGVSFVEGYRTGGVSINRYRTTAVNYDHESTSTYELSYKAGLDKFTISSNAFYTKWKKQQVQISLSTDSYDTQVTNASSSEYYGGELQANYKLSDIQDLSASVGYVQSRFVNFTSNNTNYTGKEFPNSPHWTLMMNHGIDLFSDWKVKTTLRYLGSSYANAENTKSIPEQFYVDLGAQYFYKSFIPEISVKNLLNNKYKTNSFTNLYGTYYQMSTPREIIGSISYVW
ncbi:MAG: TonB-dependent receptor [Bdellovibrionales bacterium]|nr:TonB-dependent receptor [Bdellovibrionales bacterium]